ncbi:MAG: hypothetical protein KGV51_07275, partial [Moraxellaceae bacterium]|nr:hypothetical protein [Moraxellaceae bacterium]
MPLLNWINRNQAEETAGSVPYHLLHLEQSYGDKKQAQENLIIQGDNLQALKALIPLYAGQVKCIFIDPPYNTQSAFEHYDDKLEHAQWLSMMYPRLQILKDLLAEDGFMAIQIDDREFARLYLIMTEIFNEKYLKTISIKMSEPTGVKMASINKSKGIAKLKEFIILASKNGIKGLNLEKVPKDGWDYEYNTAILGLTKNELSIIKKILDDEERTEENIAIVENLSQKITFKSAKEVCISEGNKKLTEDWLFKNAWRIVQFATLTGGAKELAVNKKMTYENIPPAFVVTTKRLKAYLIRGEFNHQTKLPRCKLLFADKYLMVHLGDFWSDIKTTGLDNEGGVDFKNGKKPEKLLERIIK